MSRAIKLAAAAAFGGFLAAATLVTAARPSAPPPTELRVGDQAPPPKPNSAERKRCRMITTPDAGCSALWDAERARFFHAKDHTS